MECVSLEESPVITQGFRASRISETGNALYGGGGNYYYYDYISNTTTTGLGSDWAQAWDNGVGPIGTIDPTYGNSLTDTPKTDLAQRLGISATDVTRLGAIRLYADTDAGYHSLLTGTLQTEPLRLGFKVLATGPAALAVLNSGPISSSGYSWFHADLDSFYISPVQVLLSDKTAPSTAVTTDPVLNSYDCINQTPITITLTATDPVISGEVNSGIDKILYKIGNQSWVTITGSSAVITPLNTQGVYQLSYYAIDHAGNAETQREKYITIDQTLPDFAGELSISPAITVNGITAISQTTISFIQPISDTYSGVQKITVDVKNALSVTVATGMLTLISGTPFTGTVTGTIDLPATLTDGTYTIVRAVVDKADNTSAPLSITVLLDRTPPPITATPDLNLWYNITPVTVTFTAIDTGSGVAAGSPVPQQAVRETEGVHEINCVAYDKIGNRSEAAFYLRIDLSKPAFAGPGTIFPSVTANGQTTISQRAITVSNPVTDTYSGAKYIKLTVFNSSGITVTQTTLSLIDGSPLSGTIRGTVTLPDSLPDGTYSFSQVLYDRAGNYSAPIVIPVALDTTTPPPSVPPVPPGQQSFTVVPLDEYGNPINALRANQDDIVYVELQGNVLPGYYWGNVLVTVTGATLVSIEEGYDNWYNGMGLWWTTASGNPAYGGAGTLYNYKHIHSPVSDTYKSEGSSWAAAWEAEGRQYYYEPGPAGSIVTDTVPSAARFYYSGYLGNHSKTRPGIRLGIKLTGTGPVGFQIASNSLNEYNWRVAELINIVSIPVEPRVNFQSVHNEGENVWIQLTGPISATVGDIISVNVYGELMMDSGQYNILVERIDSLVTGTLTSTVNAFGNEFGPVSFPLEITGASEHGIDVTFKSQGSHPGQPVTAKLSYTVSVKDKTRPETNLTFQPSLKDNRYVSSTALTIILIANDPPGPPPEPVSGVKDVYYKIGNGDYDQVIGASATITLTAQGDTTIRYFAVDNAGNPEEEKSKLITIDRSTPAFTSKESMSPGGTTSGSVFTTNQRIITVTKPISDTYSGVDYVDVIITRPDGIEVYRGRLSIIFSGTPVSGTITGTVTLPENAPDGTYTAQQAVVDKAGNTSAPTFITFLRDTIPPVVTAVPDPPAGTWYKVKPKRVTFSATDNTGGSGVADGWPDPNPVDAQNEGPNVITSYAKDNAGNMSLPKTVTINIDTINPTVSASVAPAPTPEGWNNQAVVTVTFTATDSVPGSGVPPPTTKIDTHSTPISQCNEATYSWQVTDRAGNQSDLTQKTVRVDRVLPSILYPIVSGSPVITCTVIQTIQQGAPITHPAIANFLNGITATDITSGIRSFDLRDNAPAVFPVGTTRIDFTATDKANNEKTGAIYVVVRPVTVILKSITFRTDHEDDTGNNLLKDNNANWGNTGTIYAEPEWQKTPARSNPITHNKNQRVGIDVVVEVSPADLGDGDFTITGDGEEDYLTFSITGTASGGTRTISMTAQSPLRDYVFAPTKNISWQFSYNALDFDLGQTTHTIYVTYDTPNPTTDLTEKRINWLCNTCSGSTFLNEIADSIYEAFEQEPPKFQLNDPNIPDDLWMLMSSTAYQGDCKRLALLMKQAIYLLGAKGQDAKVGYVYASTEAINCFSWESNDFETRDCSVHGSEKLAVWSGAWNRWESVCVVGGICYAIKIHKGTAIEVLRTWLGNNDRWDTHQAWTFFSHGDRVSCQDPGPYPVPKP